MSPAEIFWASLAITLIITRILADWLKIRLHVKRIHIHHFVWGIPLLCAGFLSLYFNQREIATVAAGAGVGLISSEVKELILQRWGK